LDIIAPFSDAEYIRLLDRIRIQSSIAAEAVRFLAPPTPYCVPFAMAAASKTNLMSNSRRHGGN